jgi:hypothetical protein
MPTSRLGQLITFAIEIEDEGHVRKWVTITVAKGLTVRKVCARRGHPEDAKAVARKNHIRHPGRKFRKKRKLKVPKEFKKENYFSVLAGDSAPYVAAGYAKIANVDRPYRVGLSIFEGYDPVELVVPIRFEATERSGGQRIGKQIERDIAELEKMAGRGNFKKAGSVAPPIVRLSATGGQGEIVPLIPQNYQWSRQNKHAPTWRISSIDWDNSPLRNTNGYRIRQLAEVHLVEYTKLNLLGRASGAKRLPKKRHSRWHRKHPNWKKTRAGRKRHRKFHERLGFPHGEF